MKNFTGPNPELALRVFACYPGPDGGAPLLDVDFPLLFDFDFFATSDIFLETVFFKGDLPFGGLPFAAMIFKGTDCTAHSTYIRNRT